MREDMFQVGAEIVVDNYKFRVEEPFKWLDMVEPYNEWLKSYHLDEVAYRRLLLDPVYKMLFLKQADFVSSIPSMSLDGTYNRSPSIGRLTDNSLIFDGKTFSKHPRIVEGELFYLNDGTNVVHLQARKNLCLPYCKESFFRWLDLFDNHRIKYCKDKWAPILAAWLSYHGLAALYRLKGMPDKNVDIAQFNLTKYSFDFANIHFSLPNDEDLEDGEGEVVLGSYPSLDDLP